MAPSHLFTNIHAPWETNENVIWLASTLRLRRNIEKFIFPAKLDLDRKKHIFSLLAGLFTPLTLRKNPYTLKTEEISSQDKEFLLEQFLLTEGFQEAPAGTGFGLDDTGEFIALFNIKDHIQLQLTDTKGNLEESWAALVEIENQLAKEINFSFSQKYGFLTSDPFVCGTGLTISAFLHLPALIHTNGLMDAKELEKSEGIVTTGLQGNPDEFIGDILMVRNLYTLGINEESIIAAMRSAILHLVIAEKSARSKIKNEKPSSIKNSICRAIGLVKYSYQLEATEALSALSLIKLGIELGWLKGMSVQTINRLLFYCRRSHLSYARGDEDGTVHVAEHRAEYLKQAIEPLTIDPQLA